MIINGQEEIWLEINHKRSKETAIISISNCGRLKRKNGEVKAIPYNMHVYHNGERIRCYRLVLETFRPQTLEDKLLGRYYVDHKSHNPVGMNISDVRNMRWCTQLENNGFEEARHNKSKAKKGKPTHTKGRHWKIIEGKRVYY